MTKNNKKLRSQDNDQDVIFLTDVLMQLAQQVRIIIIVPVLIGTISIIYVLGFTVPLFEAKSKIMSSSGGGGVSQALGIAAQFGISLPVEKSEQKWTYPEILKSRTLLRNTLNEKFNTNKYGSNKSLLQILTFGNSDPKVGRDTLEINAINKLLNMIKISENTRTSIITLTVTAEEPRLSAEINNLLIQKLDSHIKQYNKSKTSETRLFIEERIAETEKTLILAEENLKNFRDRNRRIQNSPSLQLEQERLLREVTVITGVYTTLKQQLETTKIEEVKESDYVVVIDQPEIPIVKSKPNRKLIVLVNIFLGLGIGVLLAFINNYRRELSSDEKKRYKHIMVVLKNKLLNFN